MEEYTGEGVFKYHNFYLPIKVQDKFYIARIVGEEWNDSKGYNPIEIKLYDLIIQKKSSPFLKTARSRLGANGELFQVTIAEMLKNVKDSNHQPFVNKDGRLAVNKKIKSSKAGNEHDNNEGNYFQMGGQYKGDIPQNRMLFISLQPPTSLPLCYVCIRCHIHRLHHRGMIILYSQ